MSKNSTIHPFKDSEKYIVVESTGALTPGGTLNL